MVSVTQVLDQFPEKELVEWQLRDPKKAKQVSEEAKQVGSAVDQQIQLELSGRLVPTQNPSLTPQEAAMALRCMEGWDTFKAEHPDILPSITGIQH